MARIPRFHLSRDDGEREEAQPIGIRTLRRSGGSVVLTIPPRALDRMGLDAGDEMVVHTTDHAITLTRFDDE